MTVVYLIYPHGPRISTPDAIGRELGARLRQFYEVVHVEWNDICRLKPHQDAVLLGHAHMIPWTVFRQSMREKGWKRVLLMNPFHHGDLSQVAFIDHFIGSVDLFLAITGNYWFETMEQSAVAKWLPKIRHLDLAVNRRDFPPIKRAFRPEGQRRFLYIGNASPPKNLPWLNELARTLPEYEFSWVGSTSEAFSHLKPRGFHDFSTEAGKAEITQHDFMITVGSADANPTTILEAMAWGLIPICTKQSGYHEYSGIVNLPLNDTTAAAAILRELQNISEQSLFEMQTGNWELLDDHFNWDRFTQQVISAIESDESPAIQKQDMTTVVKLRAAELGYFIHNRWVVREAARTLYRKVKSWARMVTS
jgi:glycosyltransferase involved in cell wall biosynthesis